MEADSFKTPLPQVFSGILDQFLRPTAPDPVAAGVIVGAGDENLRAASFAPLINSDLRYRNYLFAQTFLSERMSDWLEENAQSADRERIALDRTLGLLGKAPVRNLMACAHVEKILGTLDLSEIIDPEKKVNPRPTELIPFALASEKICQDRSWIFSEAAFSAGIHYDWLSAAIKKKGGTPEEKTSIANAFADGALTAKMAYTLGERTREIKSGKYLFAAGLLLPIGKALMGCLFPKGAVPVWNEFVAESEKIPERKYDFYRYVEHRRFPVTHAELGGLFVNFGLVLREVEKAIYFYQDPEPLRQTLPELYQLSVMLSLANRMAGAKGGDFPLESFQLAWLKKNKITEDSLKSTAADALKGK
jgi:hypothetical protein